MSVSQHTNFTAAAHLAEGQFLRAAKKLVIVSNTKSRNSKTNNVKQGRTKFNPKNHK
jgi:hypothetical protein